MAIMGTACLAVIEYDIKRAKTKIGEILHAIKRDNKRSKVKGPKCIGNGFGFQDYHNKRDILLTGMILIDPYPLLRHNYVWRVKVGIN